MVLELGRDREQKKIKKNKKGALGLVAWWACGLRRPKERKKENWSVWFVFGLSVAQRVLGAHLGCLDYRVEVQKY